MFSLRVLGLSALCMVCLAAPAFAQGLPESVAEPYVRYQTAMEGQDYDGAEPAARAAWQAAEDAGIDVETTGLLADNYAQLAHRSGHYAEAVRAYRRSAEILTELNDDPLLIAQTWRLAAQSAFLGEDNVVALALSDRAGDLLERQPASQDQATELYRARMIQSYANWDSGNVIAGGTRAQEAVASLATLGAVPTHDTANLHFYAGVTAAIRNNHSDSAFYFTIASYIWRSMETERATRDIANAWTEYARGQLTEDERILLLRRLTESPYRPADVDPSDDDDDNWRDAYSEQDTVVDASPVRRRPPRYPDNLAASGVNGVALMQFDVTEDGQTENIRVLFSVPHSDFGEAGVDSVRRWTYEPATVNGVPVRRPDVETTIQFVMADSAGR